MKMDIEHMLLNIICLGGGAGEGEDNCSQVGLYTIFLIFFLTLYSSIKMCH